jgi:putative ABC transport system permease protein
LPSLSFQSAAKIAAREMHASRGKFFFVILSVAIGVAALTGVRGFSSSFRATLLTRARSILAADLSARATRQPSPGETKSLADIEASGIQVTPVTELLSMASAPVTMDPLLVSVKSVDPTRFPFYGTVDLEPRMTLVEALKPDTVAVGDDLLLRLHLALGDQLKIGNRTYKIVATVLNEPDRLSSNFSAGPRVLMSREALDSSGLLAPGSHAGQRFLFKLPQTGPNGTVNDAAVQEFKLRLEKLLPESQVVDYRETNPALTQGLDRATSLLSLMSLVALVLGAIGVAMAMRAHLQQRLDTIAIMKSLGARSSQVIKIYLLQTLLLGIAGGLLGVGFGVGVQMALPVFLAKLINVVPDLHVDLRSTLTGLGAGVLTTLLFTLPPLLDIRNVRPILILRRAMDESNDDPFVTAILGKITKNYAQILSAMLILGGLAAIATTLSDSREVGKWFTFGLVVVLIILLIASWAVLRVLRFFLSRTRLSLPSSLRHGLANLYRPGNPSAALLAALGMGVMQIMTVYLVQQAVVSELHVASAPNLPNIFLVDMTNEEIGGIRTLLKNAPGITKDPELLPVVSSRITLLNGVPATEAKLTNMPKRMLQTMSLSWSVTGETPVGTKVIDGRWWTPEEAAKAHEHPIVAIQKYQADRLGLKVGSTVTFAAQDSAFTADVVALTKSDGQHAYGRAEFVLPQQALAGFPAVWYGGVHVDPAQVGKLQRTLYAAYPTVTVINVAAALETVRAVVVQITYVIQFLATFSIFAGIIILASSIAGTRYRRMREVVVLKTLGATRARIATIFSIEFAVLGLVAGLVGITFANLIADRLLRSLSVAYTHLWGQSLAALLLIGCLTVLTGWIASHRLLGQKPLEVLREE